MFNAAKLAAGRYLSASEVVWPALRVLEGEDRRGQPGQRDSAEKENDAR